MVSIFLVALSGSTRGMAGINGGLRYNVRITYEKWVQDGPLVGYMIDSKVSTLEYGFSVAFLRMGKF